MSEALAIESFPTAAAGASRAVVRASAALAALSADRLQFDGPFQDLLVLRHVRFDWRFYLTRQGTSVVFFFFRSDDPLTVLLEADVSFGFEPMPPAATVVPSGVPSYRWLLPPFVIWRPDLEQLALWGVPRDAFQVVCLALGRSGERVLSLVWAEDDDDEEPTLVYFAGGTHVTFDADADEWPLGAITDTIAAFRAWVETSPDHGTEVPFVPPAEDRSDVIRIVVALAEGWRAAAIAGLAATVETGDVPPALLTDYAIDDLRARMTVRLDDEGRIATADAEEHVAFALVVRVGPRDNMIYASVTVRPPDFLAAGALQSAFGDLCTEDGFRTELLEALADPKPTTEDLARFLVPPRSRWTVFRTEREDDHDTDVVVWEGALGRRRGLLICSVDVVVTDAASETPTVTLADSPHLKVHYFGDADVPTARISKKVRGYFIRLLGEIRRWTDLAA